MDLKVTSFQEDLSNEVVTELFEANGVKIIDGLELFGVHRAMISSGHYEISIDLEYGSNAYTFKATTTNMSIIDDWGEDETYFNDDNSGHWFNNHEQVLQAALDVVLSARKEEINDWLKAQALCIKN